MDVKRAIWACVLLTFAGVYCYEDITMGELPKEVFQQLNQLRTHYTVNAKEGCKRAQPIEVGFLLYSRNNTDSPTTLDVNNATAIDSTKKVILLIHGWLSNPNASGISQLKDAYLRRYDCNVLVVDWSQMAWKPYSTAFCHVSRISNTIAKFLCGSGLSLEDVHIVGHSMGAQIGGVASEFANIKCKQRVGRITGLDPSGPLFQNLPERRRLDKSDAKFVDVIHTDQVRLGYSGNCGHVDFHPNCGQHQPGCPSVQNVDENTPVSDIFCSHHRSLEYMTESIRSDQFVAVSCGMCPRSCRPDMFSEKYAVMGEGYEELASKSAKFLLHTNSSPPYALGWALYNAKLP